MNKGMLICLLCFGIATSANATMNNEDDLLYSHTITKEDVMNLEKRVKESAISFFTKLEIKARIKKLKQALIESKGELTKEVNLVFDKLINFIQYNVSDDGLRKLIINQKYTLLFYLVNDVKSEKN